MEGQHNNFHKIRTPDNDYFSICSILKAEADELELIYKNQAIDSLLLSVLSQVAYKIDNGKILYRQFYQDIGFVFPSLEDYKKAIGGVNYWNTSIQINDNGDFVVAFQLKPDRVNRFIEELDKELIEFRSFENWKFLLLKNKEIIMRRQRTEKLSDAYWFNSLKEFDFFYPILSGK